MNAATRVQTIPCKSCKAPIFFARMKAGKSMPIDEFPGDGNLRVYVDGLNRTLAEVVSEKDRADGELLYFSHFATCPKARQHRVSRR